MCVGIFIGILLVVFGIKNSQQYSENIKDYIKTQGTYVGKIKTEKVDHEIREEADTFILKYTYEVEGKEYTVFTDYSTAVIPKQGSQKTILYNPNNPEEAVIEGTNSSHLPIMLGLMFTFIPIIMIVGEIAKKNKKIRKPLEVVRDFLIGILFCSLGGYLHYFLCAGTNDFSFKSAFKTDQLVTIVSIVMLVVGIVATCSALWRLIKIILKK